MNFKPRFFIIRRMGSIYSLQNINLLFNRAGEDHFEDPAKPIQALIDIDLEIEENEFVAMIGANGSGKSSLGKLLAGIAGKFNGEIYYRGELIEDYRRAHFNDVAMVIQEPQNQILMPTVREELALPLRNRKLDSDTIKTRIGETADRFGLCNLLGTNPEKLSGGQITSLAIASSVITDPEVIILDEPDSHLDEKAKSILWNYIQEIRGRKTIILITQYFDLAKNADRVIVLEQGKIIRSGRPEDILRKFGQADSGRSIDLKNNQPNDDPGLEKSGSVLIKLENVSFAFDKSHQAINNAGLSIYRGEKIGLVGSIGSGKTTLGLLIAGLLKPSSGAIYYQGKPLAGWGGLELRQEITMAIQLPERGLFEETVGEDIGFGPRNIGITNVEDIISTNLERFHIEHLRRRHPFTLSGGEKRKAALAGILAMDTSVIILDEPSAGLDYRSTGELVKILNSQDDKTRIIISHDLNFIRSTCNRIISLSEGGIVGDHLSVNFFKDNK